MAVGRPTGGVSPLRHREALSLGLDSGENPGTLTTGRGTVAKKSEAIQLLRGVPLFSGCSDRELSSIFQMVKEVKFPAGREIFKEGDKGAGLHVVMEGETKVLVGGKTKRRLGPGAFFGEIALLDGEPRSATVVAETDVVTLGLPTWAFKSTLKAHPALALKMLEEVGRRLRSTEKSLTH